MAGFPTVLFRLCLKKKIIIIITTTTTTTTITQSLDQLSAKRPDILTGFSCFASVTSRKCSDINLLSLPSKTFPIHNWRFIPYATHSVVKSTKNKKRRRP
jgi:hypothetical protein